MYHPDAATTERVAAFEAWLDAGGVQYPLLAIAPSRYGLGITAAKDDGVARGDELLRIPLAMLLTQETAASSPFAGSLVAAWADADCPLPASAETPAGSDGGDDDDVVGGDGSDDGEALDGPSVEERTHTTSLERLVLYLYLIHARAERTTFHTPYIDLLPQVIDSTPVTYSPEVARLLAGTNMERTVAGIRSGLHALYDSHIRPLVARGVLDGDVFDMDSLLWAYSVFWSRCYGIPARDATGNLRLSAALVPLADILNHSGDVGVEYVTSLTDGYFALKTRTPTAAGCEVFSNYGDAKGNEKLLLTYGFAGPSVVEDTYFVQLSAGGAGHYLSLAAPLPDALVDEAQARTHASGTTASTHKLRALTHLLALFRARHLAAGVSAADDEAVLDAGVWPASGAELTLDERHCLYYRRGQSLILEAAMAAVETAIGALDLQPEKLWVAPARSEAGTQQVETWRTWASSVGLDLPISSPLRIPEAAALTRSAFVPWAAGGDRMAGALDQLLADPMVELELSTAFAIWIIYARHTPSAPLHGLAAALPAEHPSPVFASPSMRNVLAATPLFPALVDAMTVAKTEYDAVVAALSAESLGLAEETLALLAWPRYLWASACVDLHAMAVAGRTSDLVFLPIHPSAFVYSPHADAYAVARLDGSYEVVSVWLSENTTPGVPIPNAPLVEASNAEAALRFGAAAPGNTNDVLELQLSADDGDEVRLQFALGDGPAKWRATMARALYGDATQAPGDEVAQAGYEMLIGVVEERRALAAAAESVDVSCPADEGVVRYVASLVAAAETVLAAFK
ncbi:lysine N-methylase [Thecamonas trahens ATCC 50062]|uniref:Lysine N-methylase n=1 Tax=Thecamonas trahens ATCC 50062 TaxID=461836 RepID=A0A0L0D9N1_THETB|nr:lysine N-methylase [Thecamonas trahens ATCC 50062]KNC48003.1 lysine N-methylase [Thecamonas trahens ATCC 50062]|eukprot:XP_013759018.1 lysine N-methylase [Thecamonas trahens ATCC 50062]